MSSWVVNISKDGDSTAFLVNLFYCVTSLTIFFFFLSGISFISICAHCLSSSHWVLLRRVWFHLLYSLPRGVCTRFKDLPRAFSCQGWTGPASQPLLLCQMLQSLYHFCGTSLDLLQYVHVCLILRSLKQEYGLAPFISLHLVVSYASCILLVL